MAYKLPNINEMMVPPIIYFGKGFDSEEEAFVAYSVALDEFKSTFKSIRKAIHKIPILDKSFLITGMVEELPEEDEMFYKSPLWEGKKNLYPVNSDIFKGRFISYVITMVVDNIERILEYEIGEIDNGKVWKRKYKINEYKNRLDFLSQIQNCLITFISRYTNNQPIHRELMKIFHLSVMADTELFNQKMKLAETVENELKNLEDMQKSTFLKEKSPDNAILQNLLFLAFILSTGVKKVSSPFVVPEDIMISDRVTVEEMIRLTGKAIMEKHHAYNFQYPFLYYGYLCSFPKIKYRHDIKSDLGLREGCRALSFVGFLAQSKSIDKLLKKML